jgi:hypothetical protein
LEGLRAKFEVQIGNTPFPRNCAQDAARRTTCSQVLPPPRGKIWNLDLSLIIVEYLNPERLAIENVT